MIIEIECHICKKNFCRKKRLTQKHKHNFCSLVCAQENRRKDLVSVKCYQCGNLFKRKKSQIEKHKNSFCSQKCANIFKTYRIENIENDTINDLIKDYTIDNKSLFYCYKKYKMCNPAIKKILTNNNIKIRSKLEQVKLIRNSGEYKWKVATKVLCKICKKEFIYQKAAKTTYCSIRCRSNDNDLKDIIREHTIKQLQEGRMPKSYTSIEIAIEKILKDNNIPYIHQYRLGKFVFDFKIKDNILIECDGDYWHSNPLFYNNNNTNDRQKLIQKRDLLKNQIAKENHYILLRFWENDIKNNLNSIKNQLLSFK